MIKTLKRKVLVPLLYQSGIPFRSWKAGQQNVILNYHGVIAEPFARINNRHVSAAQFEQDLRFYHKHFDVVSLADIFAHPAGPGSKGRPKLAVTFDDGFENNLTTALPLLEKYACPATIFVMSANLAEPDFLIGFPFEDPVHFQDELPFPVHDGDHFDMGMGAGAFEQEGNPGAATMIQQARNGLVQELAGNG